MDSHENKMSFRTRAWEFWRRNNVIFVQLPLMLAWLFGSYIVLKSIDPRIGVTGFGDIFSYALLSIKVCFIIFTVFYAQKWLFFDIHDKTEFDLFKEMRAGSRDAHLIVWRDRLEKFGLLAFATWWYT